MHWCCSKCTHLMTRNFSTSVQYCSTHWLVTDTQWMVFCEYGTVYVMHSPLSCVLYVTKIYISAVANSGTTDYCRFDRSFFVHFYFPAHRYARHTIYKYINFLLNCMNRNNNNNDNYDNNNGNGTKAVRSRVHIYPVWGWKWYEFNWNWKEIVKKRRIRKRIEMNSASKPFSMCFLFVIHACAALFNFTRHTKCLHICVINTKRGKHRWASEGVLKQHTHTHAIQCDTILPRA